MTTNKYPLKVFLCYAHVDAKKVRILYDHLTYNGLDVWLDKAKLVPGQDREHEIRKAVSESDIVIFCYSKQFNQEGFHHKEVKIALEKADSLPEDSMFIIPARLEECDVSEDIRRLQSVDLFEKLPIQTAEDGYEYLLRALRLRASKVGAILRVKRSRPPKITPLERLVPDDVLKKWLIRHSLVTNPFERTDPNNYPLYPDSAVRPLQWKYLLDLIPLFARCPTAEDAQALAYRLRKECLPFGKDNSSVGAVYLHIFPIWVWLQQTTPGQPLVTLAHSAARTWLDILPVQPHALLDLPLVEQNALLELLCWSFGSNKALINLVKLNGLPGDEGTLALIHKIAEFKSGFLLTNVPQDSILLSWLRIRPFGIDQTFLILPGDDLLPLIPLRRFKRFSSLISNLSLNGIVTKVFASSSPSSSLLLQEIGLSWPEELLNRSLEWQFDMAMHSEEKSIGKTIRFNELFGPGVTEEETTQRLISESHNSLARMLALGNRLLQNHCWKNFSETYLSLDEFEDILKMA